MRCRHVMAHGVLGQPRWREACQRLQASREAGADAARLVGRYNQALGMGFRALGGEAASVAPWRLSLAVLREAFGRRVWSVVSTNSFIKCAKSWRHAGAALAQVGEERADVVATGAL